MILGAWRVTPAYTVTVVRAIDRLEALSEVEQDFQVERGERSRAEDRIRRREATAEQVRRELEHHQGRCRFLERELKRLQRDVF